MVIAHQAVGVTSDEIACDDGTQDDQEGFAVSLVDEEGLAPIAAGGDMVEPAGELDAQRSTHAPTILLA